MLPFIIGKGILIAFEEKFKEKLTGVLRSNVEESEKGRLNDCEDMVYLFCMGLFNTQEISLSSIEYAKKITLSKSKNTIFKTVVDLHKLTGQENMLTPEMLKSLRKNFAEVSASLHKHRE